MIFRVLLALAVISPLAAIDAHAQSPFDFMRKQQQKRSQPRRPPPPPPPAVTLPPAAQPGAPAAVIGNESTVPQDAPAAAPPVAAAKNTPPAPYEKDMRRISEILGALHYLRPLCGANDGQVWRDKMRDLIEAEGGPPDRRERLAGAFNEGYNGFQLTYRTCTPSADLAVRRYLEEGQKLSREIATRHGS
jgi:uncharacterized protein (TIGR02301 family)